MKCDAIGAAAQRPEPASDPQERFDAIAAMLDGRRIRRVFFGRFDERSDIWDFTPHSHGCIELLYFLYGNAQIMLGAHSFYASFYDAVVYPAGCVHTEHLQNNHHQEIYCLQAEIPGLELSEVLHLCDTDRQIKLLLDGLFAECAQRPPSEALADQYLRTLALAIAKARLLGEASADPIDMAQMFMRDHLSEDVTVDRLAALVHMSRSHLTRMFAQRTGIAPMRYLLNIRIEAAKAMLMTSSLSAGEIAERAGFNSPKYFCRVFHRETGLSPREFRQSERAPNPAR